MRIALVDPSRTTRLIVARMLEARGHDVLPFADELEALAEIRTDHRIEALITSVELKHISGVELCWETRLLATCRRPIYVLMMSSQYDQRSLIEALDSGADDFIGKPPLAEELFARLRAAERILSMQHELLRLAITDPLTVCAIAAASSSRRPRLARGSFHRPGDSVDQILARADAALYDAKLAAAIAWSAPMPVC
jgi:DNA-binding response OmpR family regulator